MYLITKLMEDMRNIKKKRKEVKAAVKETKNVPWIKLDQKMSDNFIHKQKLFYVTLKQLRMKKEYSVVKLKDKRGKTIIEEGKIIEGYTALNELSATNIKTMEATENKKKDQGLRE